MVPAVFGNRGWTCCAVGSRDPANRERQTGTLRHGRQHRPATGSGRCRTGSRLRQASPDIENGLALESHAGTGADFTSLPKVLDENVENRLKVARTVTLYAPTAVIKIYRNAVCHPLKRQLLSLFNSERTITRQNRCDIPILPSSQTSPFPSP